MPFGDLDNNFPRKSRETMNLDGLNDTNKIFVRSYYNQLMKQGFSPEEAVVYANDKA